MATTIRPMRSSLNFQFCHLWRRTIENLDLNGSGSRRGYLDTRRRLDVGWI